ncbi:MFS transporter [Phytohabitans kaempferiae]|uniref:MFS transporter n=1 Tax=Phytohabitans kaempferiae TaxID=1620943 RepID=A0ABV6M3S7_9ACTN
MATRTARGNRRMLGMLTGTHVVNDIYAGAVPALLPYLVAERHYSYAAVSGVALAATVLSSLVQPGFGLLTDRYRLGWLVGGGMLVSGIGVGLSGVFDGYLLTCIAVAISGIGVAAYHPEAARAARLASGGSAQGMSVFSVGGNIGIAIAPVLVALVLSQTGVTGTPLLAAPAVAMGVVYAVFRARLRRAAAANGIASPPKGRPPRVGVDDWPRFWVLVGVIILRSIGSVGSGAFLALYVIDQYGQSLSVGSTAQGLYGGAGVAGTLLGGWMADRLGRVETLRWAYVAAPILMAGFILSPNVYLALAAVSLLGVAAFVPFSVQVTLGQEYLPNRMGTASGVTLGIGITIGGLFTPVLGWVADQAGLGAALWLGLATLVAAALLSLALRNPAIVVTPAPVPEKVTP